MEMMSFVAAPLFSVAIWFKLFKSKGHMHDAGFIEKYTKGLKKDSNEFREKMDCSWA